MTPAVIGGLPWEVLLKWLFGGSGISAPVAVAIYFTHRSQVLAQKRQKAASEAGAVEGFAELSSSLSAELARLKAELARYMQQIELLRSARWSVEEVLLELHTAAIAARAMVHDLQRQAGVQPTEFPPLPQPSWAGSRGNADQADRGVPKPISPVSGT